MADLNDLQAAQTVKIVGSDSAGIETNPVGADAENNLLVTRKDRIGTGTITALNGAVTANTQGCSTVVMTLTGTWAATIVAEGTVDGITWVALSGVDLNTGLNITSGYSNMSGVLAVAGFSQVRARAAAFTSGNVEIAYDASSGVHMLGQAYGNNNTLAPVQSQLVGGTNGANLIPLLVDDAGRLVTSAITGFGASFTFGDVTTNSATQFPLMRTAYSSQIGGTQGQCSLVSSSALDTSVGSAAKDVIVTYYNQVGAGPFFETIALNGTTRVATVATDILYVERIRVLSTGTLDGTNAGIISIFDDPTAGALIGTIGVGDKQSFWCHHYVPLGKECNITGIQASNDSTSGSAYTLIVLKSIPLNDPNAVEVQISDTVKLYGASSSTVRTYNSPIRIAGPARLTLYCTPSGNPTQTTYGSFDYFEP